MNFKRWLLCARWLLSAGIVYWVTMAIPVAAGERVGIAAKAGTLGFGLDLTLRANDWLCFRGVASQYDHSESFEEGGIDYDGELDVGGVGVLVDFHPWKNQFRLTAGYLSNRNGVTFTLTPTQPVEIGGVVYPPALIGTLNGDVDFDSSAPYFGIGYGNAAKGPGRWRFVLDVGIVAQGAGDVTLTSTNGLVSQGDLDAEEAEIEDDIDEYEYWPVIAVGVSFRF